MDENKFEKEVRQKMEELKIQPSASVWENVEKRIQKKEPRKRLAWLFVALFFGLMLGGYYLFNQNKTGANMQPYVQNNSTAGGNSITAKKQETKKEPVKAGDKPAINFSEKKESSSGIGSDRLVELSKNNNTATLGVTLKNDQPRELIEKEVKYISPLPQKEEKVKLAEEKKETGNGILEDSTREKNMAIGLIAEKIETSSLQILVEKTKGNDSVTYENSKKAAGKPHHKWLIGLHFSAGRTLTGSGLLGLNESKSLADMSYNSPGNSGNPSNNPQVYYDPVTTNDWAFIAGAFTQKEISKGTSLVLGINYKYFSTLNEVGGWVSSGNYYASLYNNSSQAFKTYRNVFHFVEIPVSLKMETRQNKKLPFTWQLGASVSRLLSSNSLQYQQGMLYRDNSLYNKMQIGLEGGVSAILFSKHSYPISIGPYFNYGINKLSGKGLYGNKHLGSIGIRTEILFKNNK